MPDGSVRWPGSSEGIILYRGWTTVEIKMFPKTCGEEKKRATLMKGGPRGSEGIRWRGLSDDDFAEDLAADLLLGDRTCTDGDAGVDIAADVELRDRAADIDLVGGDVRT